MSHQVFDPDTIARTHNTARFLTEHRQVGWVLLVLSFLWGTYAYLSMPKRKDPEVPANVAVAVCVWPGASAERIEELVTKKIEERVAENAGVKKIESISRTSVSIVVITLDERVRSTSDELDDLRLRLDAIRDLPEGAGPIDFRKDFSNTAALMLVVASPPVGEVGVSLRARAVADAIRATRAAAPAVAGTERVTIVSCFPESISPAIPRRHRDLAAYILMQRSEVGDVRMVDGPGFVGIDLATGLDDRRLLAFLLDAVDDRLHPSEFHPDTWPFSFVRDPADAAARLSAVAGDKYSYRELEDMSALVKRTLQNVPQVSKISTAGVLEERVFLEYSQERVADLQQNLVDILGARNITLPGGLIEAQGRQLRIDPSGEFKSENEIGDVIVSYSSTRRPIYLRNSVDIVRGYETPARFLNFYRWRDAKGAWHRSRAITLAIQMRPGEQIGVFGHAVDEALASLQGRLPEDLLLARVSDQPLQVEENLELFTRSLYEAIGLVLVVALVGFWEWRSSMLMGLSIPLTVALTFGAMHLLQIDVQQVSLASLIIALGLLVDDPVVAGDAIKRELDAGQPGIVAAWLGPTKLATAILFATITNIVAYLPLLLLSGSTGKFLYSLPVVLACSLVMSRLVSMSLIPMLGYYLLRPAKKKALSTEERRQKGMARLYYRTGTWALEHRWLVVGLSVALLVAGGLYVRQLRSQFFATDLQYLSYVDVWLPEDATLTATNETAQRAERVIQEVATAYGKDHPGEDGKPRTIVESMTTYVGGGGPRFWISVFPELFQSNYAQIVIRAHDKHDTSAIAPLLQRALSASIAGARVDVRQLETGKPVGIPVAVRLSGTDMATLRRLSDELQGIMRAVPIASRVRDDWGAESFAVTLEVDPDRANFAGVSNKEVALSSAVGMNGLRVTALHEGDKLIPVVARLRVEERARLSDIRNLYVYSTRSPQKVPLDQVSTVTYGLKQEKIRRRNQFRTVTVACFPQPGRLPSEVLAAVQPRLAEFEKRLPPGYRMVIGGEHEERVAGFRELGVVMLISIGAIFMALVLQFRDAVKPFLVFSAIPFGAIGGLAVLVMLDAPFGFMAFLGVASLIGVIVSHVIVLFDFIEEAHQHGMPLREALLDAGIVRLRPVLITVGATVFALVPLALHGGPLWQPLCYVQIGGLTVATFVTLLLVPVLYAICVMDLKIVRWETPAAAGAVEGHP